MIDIELIRKSPDKVKEAIKRRSADIDIDYVRNVDEKRLSVLREMEHLRAEQNKLSDAIAKMPNDEREAGIQQSKELKDRIGHKEFELKTLEEELQALLYQIPNLPHADVPFGTSEEDNVPIREVGNKREFGFTPKDYIELGKNLDLIDTERAAEVAGARFSYLKNEAVLLEFALVQFAFSVLTSEKHLKEVIKAENLTVSPKPFVPVVPPVMIRPDVFKKMARLSEKDKDERYYLPQDDLYLVGSAEHTLGPLHMNEILKEEDLPIRYVGFSTSFRREAGSYGKDTRGIIRVHQFDKVEMESFTTSADSLAEQNFFVAIQEYLMRKLGIPYCVVMISTGDMGAPDARQIDIEAWMPGQNQYRETHTADLMTDYQARRLHTRVRRGDATEFAHMNDATVFAIGRTLIAILENYQNEDGSIGIPEVLQPYLGGLKEIRR